MTHVLEFSRRLSDADAKYFFLGERDDCNVAMVLVAVLDGGVSLDALVEEFVPNEGGVPRFADYLRRAPFGLAPPVWMPLPEEERITERYGHEVELPPGAGWEDVFAVADAMQSAPFQRGRAPWEITVIRGVPDGRTVLVMKVHHVLSDGMGFAMLFAKTFADEAIAEAITSLEVRTEPPPRGPRTWIALRDRGAALRRWFGTVVALLPKLRGPEHRRRELEAIRAVARPPRRRPLSLHSRERRLGGFRIATATWHAEAERRGGGSNELFLAVAARSVRRALAGVDLDAEPPRVAMPVALRHGKTHDGGNVTTLCILELTGTADEIADLSSVRARATEAKRKVAASTATLFEATLDLLPGRLRAAIDFRVGAGFDILATNIPIPARGKILGVPFEQTLMVAPAIGHAASLTLTTYGDHFYLAVNADRGIAPEGMSEQVAATLAEVFGDRFQPFGLGLLASRSGSRPEVAAPHGEPVRWDRALSQF